MAFERELPKWGAVGVEPPSGKQATGWLAGDKPPAEYLNWVQNRTYEALKELQEKAAPVASPAFTGAPTAPTPTAGSNDTKIATAAYVDAIATASPAATPLNLGYGLQVVTVPRNTPYNLLNITGRTLINLLGRDGNCESLASWSTFGTVAVAGASNSAIGIGSFSFVVTDNIQSYALKSLAQANIVSGKYYFVSAYLSKNSGTSISVQLSGTAKKATVTTAGYQRVGFVIAPSDFAAATNFAVVLLGITNSVGYCDGIMLNEITSTEASDTVANLLAKYPYVDDMKSIVNPYIIKSGENLLPPMTEWVRGAANIDIPSAYTMSLQSAAASSDYIQVGEFPVLPNTDYTYSATHNGRLNIHGIQSGTALVSASALQSVSFNTGSNTQINIAFLSGSAAGRYTIDKPMLNLGSTALPFKPKADDYLFFPNVQLASNVDNTIYDTLFKRDGKYWKLSRFKTLDLDGILGWNYIDAGSGYKRVGVPNLASESFINMQAQAVKYDGKILGQVALSPDNFTLSGKDIWVYVSNNDSGWAAGYNPSNAEVQAYFNGWVMVLQDSWNTNLQPYNGTGSKGWVRRYCGIGTKSTLASTVGDCVQGSGVTTVPTASNADFGWKNYKLQYQLASSTVEEIPVEGDITLHEGLNQVEVGNGMIVREKSVPVTDLVNFNINNGGLNSGSSNLKNKALRILNIYRNEKSDKLWRIYGVSNVTSSGDLAQIPTANYDPSAAYTVTYIADQYSLTSNVQSIQGEYASNLKTVVDTLATNQADISTRVGVLENTKAQKTQPQWIAPTLLNGWENFDSNWYTVGYYIDSFGFVRIRGMIRSGPVGTVIFRLPKGYRPTKSMSFIVMGNYDATTNGYSKVDITPDGNVSLNAGYVNWVSLSSIVPFMAEQ